MAAEASEFGRAASRCAANTVGRSVRIELV
jgi:hypothetical protein